MFLASVWPNAVKLYVDQNDSAQSAHHHIIIMLASTASVATVDSLNQIEAQMGQIGFILCGNPAKRKSCGEQRFLRNTTSFLATRVKTKLKVCDAFNGSLLGFAPLYCFIVQLCIGEYRLRQ